MKETNKYLRRVRTELSCSRSTKKEITAELKVQIKERFDDKPISYDRLCFEFGSPEDICAGMESDADIRLLKRRCLKRVILIIAAIAISVATVVLVTSVISALSGSGFTVTVQKGFLS